MEARDRIIVALDVDDPDRARVLVRTLRGRVGLFKVGLELFTLAGPPIVREIADMADASGLRVAFYPHTNDWMERVEDGIRLAKKVDRKNVGVMFNLCHWMKAEKGRKMKPLLKAAMPHLFVVTINGSDHEGGWDRLIQPLDSGDFDICEFLKTLKQLDYSGPIGLMCYGIKEDVRKPLTRSMTAWRALSKRLAGAE